MYINSWLLVPMVLFAGIGLITVIMKGIAQWENNKLWYSDIRDQGYGMGLDALKRATTKPKPVDPEGMAEILKQDPDHQHTQFSKKVLRLLSIGYNEAILSN